ncbi:MAG: hypothetical protein OXF02_05730, partial [Simkaniaceae bacterium]|nr:hypothetical protein [Simkaniaceae bacterium]
GHPYFPLAGKGAKRTFTEGQKERTVSYWHSGLGGDSVKKYARECGLFPSTLYAWIDEVGECDSEEPVTPALSGDRSLPERSPSGECEPLRDMSLHDVEQLWPINAEEGAATRLDGDIGGVCLPKRQKRGCCMRGGLGTAIWLDNRLGGPPLRFDPLPKGERRRYTETERSAIINYVVEQRDVKCADECAKEIGINASCISCWLREECKTYRAFSELGPDEEDLRAVDCRKLLADLRVGKAPLRIHDYTGEKYSKDQRGRKLTDVRAREQTRDGHLYFASPEKGERRVFTTDRKEGAVDYWLNGFEGETISHCAREINLRVHTLCDWVDRYGRGRRRRPLHAPEPSGGCSEEVAYDPIGGRFFRRVVAGRSNLVSGTPVEPRVLNFFEK